MQGGRGRSGRGERGAAAHTHTEHGRGGDSARPPGAQDLHRDHELLCYYEQVKIYEIAVLIKVWLLCDVCVCVRGEVWLLLFTPRGKIKCPRVSL